MLEYGFYKLDLHKIAVTHITRNPASGKVMEENRNEEGGSFQATRH